MQKCTSSDGSRIFEGGVADLTERSRNNMRQSGLSDSFVPFLNFKLKRPQRIGGANHPIHLPPRICPCQVKQGPISFVIFSTPDRIIKLFVVTRHRLSKATMFFTKRFFCHFFQKTRATNVQKCNESQGATVKLSDSGNARLMIHIIEGLNQDLNFEPHVFTYQSGSIFFCFYTVT